MSDRGLQVMKTSTQTTPEVLQNYNGRSTNKIKICVYLKEDPESISIAKITEVRRVPAMGEFIEIENNLYRVFLVCHQPKNPSYEASIAVVKTTWNDCESLIKSHEKNCTNR